jgi:hypothetical protein
MRKKPTPESTQGIQKGSEERRIGVEEAPSFSFKEQAALSDLRIVYATACRNIDVFAAAVKEVNSTNKKLKKKERADLSLKYEHDEKMVQMQLRGERYISEHEKEKRDGKDVSDKTWSHYR